ncbi:hypothetical protein [Sulfurospirillum halorespirans]|uniref:Uncharacterized protein n=1 Tax=Sulfurospirillum halorespirans DSM 13726 TaxID=1193502 RepID=A0A1D7TGU2_9BACT|nr:hypothetical protein [Sulfurospirillum halorespirans]AOO64206.1 hypothetical protein SHALO_0410 [Sulfurospirillum halorespirans DSM 13726]
MSNKYIFIDDQPESNLDPITNRLSSFGNVAVIPVSIKPFNEMINYINSNIDDIDGIILDLRLDEVPISGTQSIAQYKAPAIAQELRTLTAESDPTKRHLKDMPIVLCSTDENIKAIYKDENASHNLFDIRFLKGDTDNFELVSKQLLCLIEGYKSIAQNQNNISMILSIDESYLDKNLISKFKDQTRILTHNIAQIILKDLIFSTGLLIDKSMLIAKLGLDSNTSEDLEALINDKFQEAKYQGVFSPGWDRWWLPKIIEIFKAITGVSLVQVDAKIRIEKLIEKTEYKKLQVASLIDSNFSNRFWTYCQGYKAETGEIKPLDPLEGFKIVKSREHLSWHEYEYISFYALRERFGRTKGIQLHWSEKERYRLKKEALESVENGSN